MPPKQTCSHGVSPVRDCRQCHNESARRSMLKNYSPEKNRAKYLADQDAQVIRNQNGRARRLGIPGLLNVADWLEKKQGGCVYCGSKRYRLEIDHRIPLSRGGSNDPANIQAACCFCNRAKQDLDEAEFLEWLEALRLIDTKPPPPRFQITFRWEPPRRPDRSILI